MSNLKLQKLLYYVQGFHLTQAGGIAFNDQIKAWSHGPVVPVVYHRFKKFSWHDIFEIPEAPKLPPKTQAIVDSVLKKYGSFSGVELEDMTHAEAPWIAARVGLPIGAPQSPEIPVKALREHFSGLALN